MQTNSTLQPDTALIWRVHLLRRSPERLPALLLVLFIGVACVWLLFGRPLPVVAALSLLLGSATEYLFPITYRISAEGVTSRGLNGPLDLAWNESRRCLHDPAGLIVTSLSTVSRLDRFRGVLLRYAPDGEPGDRASVLAAILRYAPDLAVPWQATADAVKAAAGSSPSEGVRP